VTKAEALWDSFCHWTDNWNRVRSRGLLIHHISVPECPLCSLYYQKGCQGCSLALYGMACEDTSSPWCAVFQKLIGKGQQPRKPSEHMALVLYLLYLEGGR